MSITQVPQVVNVLENVCLMEESLQDFNINYKSDRRADHNSTFKSVAGNRRNDNDISLQPVVVLRRLGIRNGNYNLNTSDVSRFQEQDRGETLSSEMYENFLFLLSRFKIW